MRIALPRAGAKYDEANEAATRREIETALIRLPQSSGGGLDSRRDVEFTTNSLAANAEQQGAITMGAATQALLVVTSNRACRLRLYASEDARDDDYSRGTGVDPSAGRGTFAEFIWLSPHTKIVSPPVLLFNAEDPVTDLIWFTVQNVSGATGTISLTFTVLTLEGDATGTGTVVGGSLIAPVATDSITGTVKTDVTEADPVVYTKTTMDTEFAAINALLPSSDEKAALVGTDGTPSAANPFVTDSDPRLGGGGGGGTLPVREDPRPTSPSAYDDEFDSTTLDPKWTQSLTGAPTVDIDTTLPSVYCMKSTTSSQNATIYESYVPGVGVAASVTAHYVGFTSTQFAGGALMFSDIAGNNQVFMTFGVVGGVTKVRVHKKVGGAFTFDIITPQVNDVDECFLHMQRTSANVWQFWYSYNGRSWKYIGTITETIVIERVYLQTDSSAMTTAMLSGWDYVRVDHQTL